MKFCMNFGCVLLVLQILISVCNFELDLKIRFMWLLVYFILLLLFLFWQVLLFVGEGFQVIFMLSRFMKKLLVSDLEVLVNMFSGKCLQFVLRMCRLFISIVILGVLSVSRFVLLSSMYLVGNGLFFLRQFWKLFVLGFSMVKDFMLVCFCDVFVWFGVKGIVMLWLVVFVVFFMVVQLLSMMRLVKDILMFFGVVELNDFWIFFRV